MKTQKGITLISLTIYIIALTIVVAMVSVISTYFYTNMNSSIETINPLSEYTKFNSFFSDEANFRNIQVLECKENYIVFNNNVQYTFIPENKAIYRNKIKICREVENCTFEYNIKNGKRVVTLTIQMATEEQPKEVEYTLKN